MADFYLLRNPPINVHDFETKQDTVLACEDAAFVNASCPYDEGVYHKHSRQLHIVFKCKICVEIQGRAFQNFRSCHRRCIETHLKVR